MQEVKSHFWSRKLTAILMTKDLHSPFSFCAQSSHIHMIIAQYQKMRNDNFKVCFVVPCTLGNPSTERFTGQEAPLGCFQLNPEVRHISVPNALLTVRSLVWPLPAPPQKEIMLSPPIKLAGSQSADFCLAAESLSSYKC